MPDFRMNKDKPVGARTLSTIAGFTPMRRPKPPAKPLPAPEPESEPEPVQEKPAFEVTPMLAAPEPQSLPTMLGLAVKVEDVETSDDLPGLDEPATEEITMVGNNKEWKVEDVQMDLEPVTGSMMERVVLSADADDEEDRQVSGESGEVSRDEDISVDDDIPNVEDSGEDIAESDDSGAGKSGDDENVELSDEAETATSDSDVEEEEPAVKETDDVEQVDTEE